MEVILLERVAKLGQMLVALGLLARRHDDGGGADALGCKCTFKRGEVGCRDILVGHDGGERALQEGRHDVAGLCQHALADRNVVAAVAQRHGHGLAPLGGVDVTHGFLPVGRCVRHWTGD